MLVEGPAGIGKTQLLDWTAAYAEQHGLRVLRARGGELEQGFGYGVVRQLLERAVDGLGRDERRDVFAGAAVHALPALGSAPKPLLAPVLGGGLASDRDFSVPHGLYWLVAKLSDTVPLALVVDDLHWVDAASLRFLGHLVRRLDGLRVLVCAAARGAERAADGAVLAALKSDAQAHVLRPSPLSPESVAALVGGADISPTFATACHGATGGNPFLVAELGAALRAAKIAPTDEGAKHVAGMAPSTISHAILLRLGGQPAAAAALARAVALLGTDVDLPHAALIAGLTAHEAAEAADRLAAENLLRPGRPLEFVHPIVRKAIQASLPGAELARGHARAAALLAGEGADHERVALHLLATDPAGDADAVACLRAAAGRALGRGAPDSAARFLERARCEPPAREARSAVAGELGVATLRSGDAVQAARHLGTAMETAGPRESARWGLVLARALTLSGDIAGAVGAVERGHAEAARVDDDLGRCVEAELSIGFLDPAVFPHLVPRLERHAGLPGDTSGERLLLGACARALALGERPVADAVAVAHRSLGRGLGEEDSAEDSHAWYGAIWTLVLGDDLAGAERALAAGARRARAHGSAPAFVGVSVVRALAHLAAGSIAKAEADARAAMEAVDAEHLVGWPIATAALVEALVERGRIAEAESALAGLDAIIEASALTPVNRLRYSRARVHLAAGRPAQAVPMRSRPDAETSRQRSSARSPRGGWSLHSACVRSTASTRRASWRLASSNWPGPTARRPWRALRCGSTPCSVTATSARSACARPWRCSTARARGWSTPARWSTWASPSCVPDAGPTVAGR